MTVVVEALIDGVWTNISSYVMYEEKVVMKRGESELASQISSATATFCLKNGDNRFSSDSPRSIWYRKFVKATPIRITCTEDADPARFRGEISRLRPTRDKAGQDKRVYVECAGMLRRILGRTKPLKSAMYRAIAATTPTDWWSLEAGDERATTTVLNRMPGRPALVAAPASTGGIDAHRLSGAVGGAVVGPPGAAKATDLSKGGQLSCNFVNFPSGVTSTTSWTFEISFMVADPIDYSTGAVGDVFRFNYGADSIISAFVGESPTELIVEISDGSAFDSNTYQLMVLDDGAWHHFRLTMANGTTTTTTYNLYVDGEFVMARTNNAADFGQPRRLTIASGGDMTAVSHAVLYHGTNIPAQNYVWDAHNGHAGETTGERLTRICAEEGITFSIEGYEGNTLTLGPQLPETLGDIIKKAIQANRGFLYEPRDDMALVYRTFMDTANNYPALRLSWADHKPYGNIMPSDDDFDLANIIEAKRPDGGEPQTFTIPDSDGFWHWTTQDPEDDPDGVGPREGPAVDANVETDALARHLAAWDAHIRSWREPRYPSISVHMQREAMTAALKLAAASVQLGDRIEVYDLPEDMPAGPALTMVIGEEETVDQFERVIEWNTVPALTREVEVVESSGSSLVVAIDNDDTSLRIATTLGREWSTTDEPYYMQIGGDVMRVTGMVTDTPTFVAAGTIATGNNASVAPGIPAGMAAGGLMLLWATIRNSGTGTVNVPTGWTSLVNFGNTRLMYRYWVSGDAAPTVTFTGGVANADTMARIFGFSNLSHGIATYPKSAPAAITSLNSSAQNMAYSNFILPSNRTGVSLIFAWKQDDWTGVAPPTGFTEMGDNATTTGDDAGIAAYYDLTGVTEAAGSLVVTGGASAISRTVALHLRPLQTATVVRDINGAAVSHAVGDELHAWRMGLNGL